MNDGFLRQGGAESESGPSQTYMGGAARRVSAALLGAPSSSHAQKPPTNEVEGAAKEENVGAMHGRELRAHMLNVKDPLLTKVKLSLGCRSELHIN